MLSCGWCAKWTVTNPPNPGSGCNFIVYEWSPLECSGSLIQTGAFTNPYVIDFGQNGGSGIDISNGYTDIFTHTLIP